MKKYNRENIMNFNESDWTFKNSSGYNGWENNETGEWIYENEFLDMHSTKSQYEYDYCLIHDFIPSKLPLGSVADFHIYEFLDNKYFKQ